MNIRLESSASLCIFSALLCLTLPLPWLIAALTAAMVHEGCHILAVFLSGGTVYRLTIGAHGAVIEASSMTWPKQMICILAGPAGSLLLLLTAEYLPRLALCGLVQGLFNLMPLHPLDGGRALRCIMDGLFDPQTAVTICRWIERFIVTGIAVLGMWAFFFGKLGILPFIPVVFCFFGISFRKTPCKEGHHAVQ